MLNNWTGYSRVCVLRILVHEVLKELHDGITGTAHASYEKTNKRVAQIFYWPRMSSDIKINLYTCVQSVNKSSIRNMHLMEFYSR
jgi:hypothetical protein